MKRIVISRKWLILPLAMVLVIIAGVLLIKSVDPYRETTDDRTTPSLPLNMPLTREQAEEDLEFLADKVSERHCSAVKGLPAEFSAQYEKELSALPENPTVLDVWRASSRILKTLEDGHSAVYYIPAENIGSGLDLTCKDGDFYINTTDGEKKLISFAGKSIEEIYKSSLETTSYENEYYARHLFCQNIRSNSYLNLWGIPPTMEIEIKLDGVAPGADIEIIPRENEISEPFSYTIDKQNKVGILTINNCTVNDDYLNTLEDFFAEVKKHEIKNIAVDLRKNGGGNSAVFDEFARYLNIDGWNSFGTDARFGPFVLKIESKTVKNNRRDNFIYGGKVYILTSNETFSSAMMFSVYTQDNGIGEVIGEPSGNKPSSYGDIIVFRLPNSRLQMVTTYKHFHRPDSTKDAETAQVPDYPVPADEAVDKFYELTVLN